MAFSLDSFSLKGKVAIVTGAGARQRSIGAAYAGGLCAAGASVLVADLNGEGAKTVAKELSGHGGKVIGTQVDITDPASAKRMVETANEAFGGVDILVNNAALMVELSYKPISATPLDEWNRLLAVNVNGALICSQAAIPYMRMRGGGRIINQVSGGAYPATSGYGVSKLALVAVTTTLAMELGRDRITVNAIAPGNVASEAGRMSAPQDSPFMEMLRRTVALRPTGEPDELVGALLLLASPAGDWITGQVLHVDGGWILRP
jgi:NAD(P)-dependent dehydrogenase (short-subunit alcohol dehydrogenase family)